MDMFKSYKVKIQLLLWFVAIGAVIMTGLYYLPLTPDKPGFWESLFHTLKLFLFDYELPTFPTEWPLILIIFLAPLITVSALGAAVSYLIHISPSIRTRWMSDHVVVCGTGRIGKLIAEALKDNKVSVVCLDKKTPEEFDEWRYKHKIPLLFGDFHARALLEKAGAAKARAIIFASGDDLANLEGALGAYEWLREDEGHIRLLWAHIANERLADMARLAVRTEGKVGIRFFDTYRIASLKMVAKYFNREKRKGVSEVNILGFGKFGRDLMDIIASDLAPEENLRIKVIDARDRSHAVKTLAEELGIGKRVSFKQEKIQEMDLKDEIDKAFFLCTDDDLGNLTAAMSLAGKMDATHIYVRMAHWPLSAVSEHLGEDRGVHFVNINDLMSQGIEHLPGIFEKAKDSDLKRLK